jgi:ribulose-phosphate 3-epimerase
MAGGHSGRIRIAPSLLSADFSRLADEVAVCESGGADWLHIDVMDGQFVPNLTFGTKIIETVRRLTRLPLDVHLMVVRPETYFEEFASAGATGLTIHVEAAPHLHRQVQRIRELGCSPGVALNPSTGLETVREIVPDIDLLLVMTVNPGFGGQKFITAMLDKVARARDMLDAANRAATLEVDGGISRDTIAQAHDAGADTFVAGHAIFTAREPRAEIAALRNACAARV